MKPTVLLMVKQEQREIHSRLINRKDIKLLSIEETKKIQNALGGLTKLI